MPGNLDMLGQPAYQHVEAFCLMKYQTDDGSETEYVWNSRDGVTPFVTRSRSGKDMTHVDWGRDRRILDYHLPPGSRMFVDVTEEAARKWAEEYVERYWHDAVEALNQEFGSREAAIEHLTKEYWQPGAPMVVEVPGGG